MTVESNPPKKSVRRNKTDFWTTKHSPPRIKQKSAAGIEVRVSSEERHRPHECAHKSKSDRHTLDERTDSWTMDACTHNVPPVGWRGGGEGRRADLPTAECVIDTGTAVKPHGPHWLVDLSVLVTRGYYNIYPDGWSWARVCLASSESCLCTL